MGINLINDDIGYLFNKTIVNGKSHIFKSIVGTGRELSLSDLNLNRKSQDDHIICRHEDEIYFVSDLAIKESGTVFYSLKEDRFEELALDILIRCSMAMGLGSGFHEAYVISGLPLQQYKMFKDNISKLFLPEGTIVHEYNVTIGQAIIKGGVRLLDGRFIPQPFGVMVNEVLDDKGAIRDKKLAQQTLAVVDIGFGTTDVYVSNTLEPVERLSFSTKTAMNSSYKLIAEKILEKCGIDEPLYKIERIVQTGKYKCLGKSYDMSKIISWSMKSTADTLISELFNKWVTLSSDIDTIILAGGGGIRLSNHILKEFSTMRLSQDGQWAVANGYRKWGRRTWKDVF